MNGVASIRLKRVVVKRPKCTKWRKISRSVSSDWVQHAVLGRLWVESRADRAEWGACSGHAAKWHCRVWQIDSTPEPVAVSVDQPGHVGSRGVELPHAEVRMAGLGRNPPHSLHAGGWIDAPDPRAGGADRACGAGAARRSQGALPARGVRPALGGGGQPGPAGRGAVGRAGAPFRHQCAAELCPSPAARPPARRWGADRHRPCRVPAGGASRGGGRTTGRAADRRGPRGCGRG
jgi:hypothetical protein